MPNIVYLKETTSTNSYIKQLLVGKRLDEGFIVCAEFQTVGRGQKGNGWESERSKNLLFSIVLYPTAIKITDQFVISQIASLAIKETLSQYTDNITIKWPNDIYWQNKKIAGILIENTLSENGIDNTIIGIGLNINQVVFESNAPNPISLRQITGEKQDLQVIMKTIKAQLLLNYSSIKDEGITKIDTLYKESLFRKDSYHLYNDGIENFEAKIINIESTGTLVLQTKAEEIRKFAFKEVKYVI